MARRSRSGGGIERFASSYLDGIDIAATHVVRLKHEPEQRTETHHHKSLRYRVAMTEVGGIVEPGACIIETRYRGRTATWSVAPMGGYPTTVGGHFDPVTRTDDDVHDPATCPECIAAALEEAIERESRRAG